MERNSNETKTEAELSGGTGSRVPDGVASAQANPLRDGAVLALSLSKLLLGAEGLVALLVRKKKG
jgi:hypothetical protein